MTEVEKSQAYHQLVIDQKRIFSCDKHWGRGLRMKVCLAEGRKSCGCAGSEVDSDVWVTRGLRGAQVKVTPRVFLRRGSC